MRRPPRPAASCPRGTRGRAAAGRDVGHRVGEPELRERGGAVAAADHGRAAGRRRPPRRPRASRPRTARARTRRSARSRRPSGAARSRCAYRSAVRGPMSRPIQPAGLRRRRARALLASASKRSPSTRSTGSSQRLRALGSLRARAARARVVLPRDGRRRALRATGRGRPSRRRSAARRRPRGSGRSRRSCRDLGAAERPRRAARGIVEDLRASSISLQQPPGRAP